MARKKESYSNVRQHMRPGDVIAFGGKGNFSQIIKWATRSSISHVGVVLQSKLLIDGQPQQGFFNQIIESTSDNGFSGVAISRLSDRVNRYEGEIWWLPLSDATRSSLSLQKFFNFCLHQEGKPFDTPQAVKSAMDTLDNVPVIGGATHNIEDFSKFFCSELVAGALEAAGAIGKLNASEVTPIDLVRFALFAPNYYQLKGSNRNINGHNTTDPEGFGI